jgi:ZIP family zinc transporter
MDAPNLDGHAGSMDVSAQVADVWAALALGMLSSVGLLAGMIAGAFSRLPHRRIAVSMAFGAGLLLAGVSLTVTVDVTRRAGVATAASSLLLGAAVFSASNALLATFGAAHRTRCGECVQQPTESQQRGSGVAIALGSALDAAPEALVLGVALRDPVAPVGLAIAFSLGNLPVALSSTTGMRTAGRSHRYIVLVWTTLALGTALAVAAGYIGLGSLGGAWPPRLRAFGAGALLAMTAETMIPEAVHDGPRYSGVLAAAGFALLLTVHAAMR